MFWKNFVTLCNEKNTSPTAVCAEIGYSNAIATKWRKGAIPRNTTLHKIADYFGVSVDYLLGDEKATTPTEPKLSEGEKLWLQLYNSVSEDTRNILIGMMFSLDKLPNEFKEEAINRVRDDLKSLE